MKSIIDDIMAMGPGVRYVAVYRGGELETRQRPGLANASAAESDQYEERIVNPVLLKLVQQRGDIDCGGARWVAIRYGHFFQLVLAAGGGHVSVGLELDQDPVRLAPEVLRLIDAHGLA